MYAFLILSALMARTRFAKESRRLLRQIIYKGIHFFFVLCPCYMFSFCRKCCPSSSNCLEGSLRQGALSVCSPTCNVCSNMQTKERQMVSLPNIYCQFGHALSSSLKLPQCAALRSLSYMRQSFNCSVMNQHSDDVECCLK